MIISDLGGSVTSILQRKHLQKLRRHPRTLDRRGDAQLRQIGLAHLVEDSRVAIVKMAHEAASPMRFPLHDTPHCANRLTNRCLARVAPLVRRGGTLLYAVCTLTREEGPDAVAALRAEHPEFVPTEGDSAVVPARLAPAAIVLRPDTDETDGFMVFRLRRGGNA